MHYQANKQFFNRDFKAKCIRLKSIHSTKTRLVRLVAKSSCINFGFLTFNFSKRTHGITNL